MFLAFAQVLRSMGLISPLWIYCCRSSSILEVLWLHPWRKVGAKKTASLYQAEQNNGMRSGWLEFLSVSDLVPANPTGRPLQQGFPQPRRWDTAPRSFAQGEQFLCPCLNLCSNHPCFEQHGKAAEICRGCAAGSQGSRRDPAVGVSREKTRLALERGWKWGHLWSCLLFSSFIALANSKQLFKNYNSDPKWLDLR